MRSVMGCETKQRVVKAELDFSAKTISMKDSDYGLQDLDIVLSELKDFREWLILTPIRSGVVTKRQ